MMNTGPVGAGREVGRRNKNGDQRAGAHLRTAHPKVRTQKKCLTLETYRALAPRIRLKPGWNQGRGGACGGKRSAPERVAEPSDLSPMCSTILSLLCLRSGRNVSPEVQRVLRVILRVDHAFARYCAGFIRHPQLALCFCLGIQLLCNRQKCGRPAPPGV